MKHSPSFLWFAVFIAFFSLACDALPIPWNGPPFVLSTRGAKLADVLRDLGANYSIPVVVSNQVEDAYVGTLNHKKPEEALNQLARLYKLIWYYDGQSLYVYKAQEINTQLLTPSYLKIDTLLKQLTETGIIDGRSCRAQPVPHSNAMEISGVPPCIERIQQMAKRLDEQMLNEAQNQETVQVFPLKYASAADNTYTYRSQQVVVPGVVTVLNQMAQGRTLPLGGKNAELSAADRTLPMFAADSRQNAVIVRDRKKMMSLYADLVRQLDQKPALIEISVAIIDVDAGDLNTLGIDWSGVKRIGAGTVALNAGNNAGLLASGSFSTVISNTGNFLIQISALEQHSKAKILSRPSVVTLNNVQAILDRNITFYTKLVGENVATLNTITSGSLLRVTPRLVDEEGKNYVLLTLNIQDGRQTQSTNLMEPLPQVQNSEIATQAALKAGQSLLLGGFVQDEQIEGNKKIPFLGDIPILGRLFSSTTKSSRSVVRLFLIQAEPTTQQLGTGS